MIGGPFTGDPGIGDKELSPVARHTAVGSHIGTCGVRVEYLVVAGIDTGRCG